MTRHFDRAKTLDELDPPAWGQPTLDSYLVETCHALRRKAVAEFSVEDLRIMIGQSIGLPFLMPLALEVIERDPLAQGDLYPGDLLGSVLRVSAAFWSQHPDDRGRVTAILANLRVPPTLKEAVEEFHEHAVVPSA